MSYITDLWEEILYVSGLTDAACERYGHDLLDGYLTGIPDIKFDVTPTETFIRLCKLFEVHGPKDIKRIELVLDRMRTIEGFSKLRLPDEVIQKISEDELEVKGMIPIRGITHNTSLRRGTYSNNWGTPNDILNIVREQFGPITLDLASDAKHNDRIKASKFYSIANPCPAKVRVESTDVVYANPPGPCNRVKYFWQVWLDCIQQGAKGAFLIFNGDHFRQIPAPKINLLVIALRKRIRFVNAPSSASFPSYLIFSNSAFLGYNLGEFNPYSLSKYGHLLEWK